LDAIETSPQRYARIAGLLYLIIIAFGIWSEVFVRATLIVPGDAAATADAIAASDGMLMLSFAADTVMLIADVALAVLFFVLFRPVSRTLSAIAAAFRLIQAAVIAAALLNQFAASWLLGGGVATEALGPEQIQALAAFFLDLHGHGYDLGLIFFGVSCLLLGALIVRSGFLPWLLGLLAMAAGVVYLVGSYTVFLLPDYAETVQPIYVIALVSEVALCLWLLIRGVNAERWRAAAAAAPA
jgi:hypothetical protein